MITAFINVEEFLKVVLMAGLVGSHQRGISSPWIADMLRKEGDGGSRLDRGGNCPGYMVGTKAVARARCMISEEIRLELALSFLLGLRWMSNGCSPCLALQLSLEPCLACVP